MKNIINLDLIKPLPKKKIEFKWLDGKPMRKEDIKKFKRVLFFNPKKLYKKVAHKIDPKKRHQGIQMDDIFPKVEGKCACGCSRKPKGGVNTYRDGSSKEWHSKWAPGCQEFASDVLSIMNNYFGKPALYVSVYYGQKCAECDETTGLELDHIIGVKHGGGACWLSNYKWLCKKCHTKKTNMDFNRGEFKNPQQLKIAV